MTRRVQRSPVVLHRLVVSLILTLLTSGCAGGAAGGGGVASAGGTTTNLSYGYMVPGPEVARLLGVDAADTLPEIPPRTTLPAVLLNGFAQEVRQGNWNDRCTRRFGGPRGYALLFHRACDSSLGPEAEPVAIVGFAATGRTLGRVAWSGPATVTLLYPARRF